MKKGEPFVERDVFEKLLATVATASGSNYVDVKTIYGDMSRLVVAWLASSSEAELKKLYNDLGWGGSANVRAIHACAKEWMQKHRSAD